jgi:iron complex outermembrane receptor protein
MLRKILYLPLLFSCHIWAQTDSIALDEVVVSDAQLHRFSESQAVLGIGDSIIAASGASLTDLLQANTPVYFKENGYGMVSSPAFRGTTAQQTAVVWNGININSVFNGQTDFNTVATANLTSVDVRAGGGSVLYGSSAIGGTVHLNNDLRFDTTGTHHRFHARYGSFDTQSYGYAVRTSTEKFAVSAGVVRNRSDNDYRIGDRRHNVNGQFYNNGIDVASGLKLSSRQQLRLYARLFESERHFSLVSPTDTKSKYRDLNTSALAEWEWKTAKWTAETKVAFLTEYYRFYETLESENPDYGKAETALAKVDVAVQPTAKLLVNAVVDYAQTKGNGSDIESRTRGIASAAVLVRHQIGERFSYEAGLRQEATPEYDSPLLYSAGLKWRCGGYSLKINGSRNFRIPTFNDLYWSEGSNRDLRPECSTQVGLGNTVQFKGVELTATIFAIDLTDMIQWLPGTTSIWFPQNIRKARSRGIEAMARATRHIGRHRFEAAATYAYTKSTNEDGHQLIYVPLHKATASLAWSLGNWRAFGQWLFTGEVFTRSDNNPRHNLDPYGLLAVGIGYKAKFWNVGVRAQNVFDTRYETQIDRPLPGKNFNLYLTLNI